MKITIVHGAPASGKTTYVKNHMKRGDLIVDLDELKKAISYCGKETAPDSLLPVALELRRCLLNMIRFRQEDAHAANAWIVTCANPEKVRALAFDLGAHTVEMKATKEECIERAMNDPEREDKNKQIAIIYKYFEGIQ